jgi:hypothetical protein
VLLVLLVLLSSLSLRPDSVASTSGERRTNGSVPRTPRTMRGVSVQPHTTWM